MNERRWINQYIALCDTLPDCLASCSNNGEFLPESLQSFQDKAERFPLVYCELGSGSGNHLIGRAAQDHKSLYIGIERRYKRAFRTAEKAKKASLENIFVFRSEIEHVLPLFHALQFAGCYALFPDPWEKKRWIKHRFLNTHLLQFFYEKLRPGGFFAYKTDHVGYFDDTHELIRQTTQFQIDELSRDFVKSSYTGESVSSEFEMLFRSQHLPIHYLKVIKPSGTFEASGV